MEKIFISWKILFFWNLRDEYNGFSIWIVIDLLLKSSTTNQIFRESLCRIDSRRILLVSLVIKSSVSIVHIL